MVRRYSWLTILSGLLCFASVAGIIARCSYNAYSDFSNYDDEGYVYVTIKPYLEGHALYSDVYTQYGPFYYIYKQSLHLISGFPVSHDSGRLFSLIALILTALLLGATMWRVTRSACFATYVAVLCAIGLGYIMREPGHPQELIAVCISLYMFLATDVTTSRGKWVYCVGAGCITSALLMTKINIGIFVLLGSAFSFVMFSKSSPANKRAYGVIAALGCLLPFALMHTDLHSPWALSYALIASLSWLSAVLIGTRISVPTLFVRGHVGAFAASLALCLLMTSAIVIAHGTSVHFLIEGMILQHLHFSRAFLLRPELHPRDLLWSLMQTGFAIWLYIKIKRSKEPIPSSIKIILTGMRLSVACLFIVHYCSVWNGISCLWLMVFPYQEGREDGRRTFYDVTQTFLILLLVLQAYPVAGSQIDAVRLLGSSLMLLSLWDTYMQFLKRTKYRMEWTRFIAPSMSLILCLIVAWTAQSARREYFSRSPVNLPGSHSMRLKEYDVSVYRFISSNASADFDTFLTVPGMNSFYFWAQKKPPTNLNATIWMTLFDAHRQNTIIRSVQNNPNVGIIRNVPLTNFWFHNGKQSSGPLIEWVEANFETFASINGYELMVRHGRPIPELREAVIVQRLQAKQHDYRSASVESKASYSVRVYAPVSIIEKVFECVIVETETGQILGRIPVENCLVQSHLVDVGANKTFEDGHSTSKSGSLVFTLDNESVGVSLMRPTNQVVVRLLNRDQQCLDSVPVVSLQGH
jgi:hypothetical protein